MSAPSPNSQTSTERNAVASGGFARLLWAPSPLSSAATSYLKTTAVSAGCALAAVLVAVVVLRSSPGTMRSVVAASAFAVALAFGIVCAAGAVVIARWWRDARGLPDLFLARNRAREVEALRSAKSLPASPMRRALARRVFGHDLVVGDVVEVKSWPEIRATLDARHSLEALPFMPEMLAMCGRRAVVYRCMHRLFDHRTSRRIRHMQGTVLLVDHVCDGASHFGCNAACQTIWKAAWLRRIEPGEERGAQRAATTPVDTDDRPTHGTKGPRYVCQLTELNAASHPIERPSILNFIRPLVARNVTPSAFAVGVLTILFNLVQHHRGGAPYPALPPSNGKDARSDAGPPLGPGDRVVVRSPVELRATLDARMHNRGLWFESDMLKHCGRRCEVEVEVKRLIDIVTGEMLVMKTPAYVLKDVRYSGERQLFNTQNDAFLWRSVWLRREGA